MNDLKLDRESVWDILAKQLCFENERDMLTTLYMSKSVSEIATMLKCGQATIHRRLGLYGIKLRQRGGAQGKGEQKYKLFHVDQRVIMFIGLTYAAKQLKVSNATLYKYKRWASGGTERGYNRNVSGTDKLGIHPGGVV